MILFDLSYIARRWQSEYLNNHEITLLMFLIASGVLFIVSVAIGESHQNLLELSDSAIVFPPTRWTGKCRDAAPDELWTTESTIRALC